MTAVVGFDSAACGCFYCAVFPADKRRSHTGATSCRSSQLQVSTAVISCRLEGVFVSVRLSAGVFECVCCCEYVRRLRIAPAQASPRPSSTNLESVSVSEFPREVLCRCFEFPEHWLSIHLNV